MIFLILLLTTVYLSSDFIKDSLCWQLKQSSPWLFGYQEISLRAVTHSQTNGRFSLSPAKPTQNICLTRCFSPLENSPRSLVPLSKKPLDHKYIILSFFSFFYNSSSTLWCKAKTSSWLFIQSKIAFYTSRYSGLFLLFFLLEKGGSYLHKE